jgi:glucosamine kinase
MILIADAGATKTMWAVVDRNKIQYIPSTGINPVVQNKTKIIETIETELVPKIQSFSMDKIFYYGAGCRDLNNREKIKSVLQMYLDAGEINIDTDLLGAARAVFFRSEGIICILGTGSNSGLYNGCNISREVSALGYILGDEGSGADIGKRFVKDILYELCPKHIIESFLDEFKLSKEDILRKIYQAQDANVFLASIAGFLQHHIESDYVIGLLNNSFRDFFQYHVIPYTETGKYNLGFVGSAAFANQELIRKIAGSYQMNIMDFIKSPIENLVKYHLNLNAETK